MNLEIVVEPEAEADIKSATAYYQRIKPSLAKKFTHDLHSSFLFLKSNPEASPVVYKHYRRSLLNIFPYVILIL